MSLARAIDSSIEAAEHDKVLIDGVRQSATVDRLRDLIGRQRIGVIYVSTPPDVAFEFYRARENHNASLAEFLAVRDGPSEHEVPAMKWSADAIIYNWFGLDPYLKTMQRLMQELQIHARY